MTGTSFLHLREVEPADLDAFFEHQQDSDACFMAAFTAKDPSDRDAFDAHWSRILAADNVTVRTVAIGAGVAGHVASFVDSGRREVTYWLGREYWGLGFATAALREFLSVEGARPLYARAAADNRSSVRVLEKCGFRVVGRERGFANARGEEIDELVLELTG